MASEREIAFSKYWEGKEGRELTVDVVRNAYFAGWSDRPLPSQQPLTRPTFPILNGNGACVDYQLVADHGGQAQKNHYQSVDRLAQRGGLSWCELHAVLHDRAYQKMDQNTAIIECRALEARYLTALAPPSPQTHLRGDAEKMINEFEKAFFMRCMAETDARKRAYETAKCKLIAALATEGKV